MSSRLWQIVFSLLLAWGIWISYPASVWAVDANLETAVLEVIRQHPEAILESLATYQAQQQEQAHQAQLQTLEQLKQNIPAVIGSSPILKQSPHSSVTLIEFADYECPFCVQAHPELKQFLQQHPSVALVYKHLPLTAIHPQALPAAKASWAASQQGKFWEFHNAIFERQGNLDEPVYQAIATQLKLNLEQFERDRNSDAATQAIDQDIQLANNLKMEGTPSFLVLGSKAVKLIPGADFQALEAIASQEAIAQTTNR